MIFDRLANEHPETCTWKQQEIPCSSKGSFVGSHAVVLSGEVIDAGFANPVENCFVKKYHDVEKLEVKQKVWDSESANHDKSQCFFPIPAPKSVVKLKSTKKRKSSEIAATNLNIPQAQNYGQHIHRSIPPELALVQNGRFWDFVSSAVKQLRVAW